MIRSRVTLASTEAAATHAATRSPFHTAALERHGPCPEHRMRFVNVRNARDLYTARVTGSAGMVDDGAMRPESRALTSTEDR